jgi:protocatechuate 3,4-dioxygenase beta subunit
MATNRLRLAGFLGVVALAACGGPASTGPTPTVTTSSPATTTSAAASCSGQATPSETEGPYFKAGSPRRSTLVESGMAGTRLSLTGRLLSRDCAPLAGAKLDFWQANAAGAYDNSGYRLRGNQLADAEGRYALQTIVPGLYPGRTEHIHVKVQPAGKSTLTTQLYFPGVSRNQQDSIFDARLLVQVTGTGSPMTATFDFIIDAG